MVEEEAKRGNEERREGRRGSERRNEEKGGRNVKGWRAGHEGSEESSRGGEDLNEHEIDPIASSRGRQLL